MIRAPKTDRQRRQQQAFLLQFTLRYGIKKGKLPDNSNDDAAIKLLSTLGDDRGFWKLITHAVCYPRRRPASGQKPKPLSHVTVRNAISGIIVVYKVLIGRGVENTIIQECLALIDHSLKVSMRLNSPRFKEYATFTDVQDLIRKGIFSDKMVYKCPRERLQLVSLINLILYTAARPGELVISDGYNNMLHPDALKWNDVCFYLMVDKVTGKIRLLTKVTIRNLKGLRNDDGSL